MRFFQKIVTTQAPAAVVLIRLLVGLVFFSEGIQKFMFPDALGAGRFAKIGLPQPEFLSHFVGVFEITCGSLIVFGFLTRLAVIPTIVIILVAITTTKIPMLVEGGFWQLAHEIRTDFSMLLGSLFLLIVGAGRNSADALIAGRVSNDFVRPSNNPAEACQRYSSRAHAVD